MSLRSQILISGLANQEDNNEVTIHKRSDSFIQIKTKVLRESAEPPSTPFNQPFIQEEFNKVNIEKFYEETEEQKLNRVMKFIKEQKKTKFAIDFLIRYFSDFRFFQQISQHLSENQLQQIIFELNIETFDKQEIIFNHNDVGRHMYFILAGKVAVLIPSNNAVNNSPRLNRTNPSVQKDNLGIDISPKKDSQFRTSFLNQNIEENSQSFSLKIESFQSQENLLNKGTSPNSPRIGSGTTTNRSNQFSSFSTYQKQSFKNSISFKDFLQRSKQTNQLDHMTDDEEFQFFKKFKFQQWKHVNTVKHGNSFGEIALEQRIPRTASVVTITECQLATLSYESFRKLLSKIYEKIQDEKRSFLKDIHPLNTWPNYVIMLIFNNCEKVEFSVNNIIYKEGDPSSYVYFIKEGEVEISQNFKVDKCDTMTLQKKNVVTKRIFLQKLVKGGMFGEFEYLPLYIESNKTQNFQFFKGKGQKTIFQRKTQAISKTRVKLMRMDLELFFNNLQAMSKESDLEYFSGQLKGMNEKINRVQNSIQEYENQNQQQQETTKMSEMLVSNFIQRTKVKYFTQKVEYHSPSQLNHQKALNTLVEPSHIVNQQEKLRNLKSLIDKGLKDIPKFQDQLNSSFHSNESNYSPDPYPSINNKKNQQKQSTAFNPITMIPIQSPSAAKISKIRGRSGIIQQISINTLKSSEIGSNSSPNSPILSGSPISIISPKQNLIPSIFQKQQTKPLFIESNLIQQKGNSENAYDLPLSSQKLNSKRNNQFLEGESQEKIKSNENDNDNETKETYKGKQIKCATFSNEEAQINKGITFGSQNQTQGAQTGDLMEPNNVIKQKEIMKEEKCQENIQVTVNNKNNQRERIIASFQNQGFKLQNTYEGKSSLFDSQFFKQKNDNPLFNNSSSNNNNNNINFGSKKEDNMQIMKQQEKSSSQTDKRENYPLSFLRQKKNQMKEKKVFKKGMFMNHHQQLNDQKSQPKSNKRNFDRNKKLMELCLPQSDQFDRIIIQSYKSSLERLQWQQQQLQLISQIHLNHQEDNEPKMQPIIQINSFSTCNTLDQLTLKNKQQHQQQKLSQQNEQHLQPNSERRKCQSQQLRKRPQNLEYKFNLCREQLYKSIKGRNSNGNNMNENNEEIIHQNAKNSAAKNDNNLNHEIERFNYIKRMQLSEKRLVKSQQISRNNSIYDNNLTPINLELSPIVPLSSKTNKEIVFQKQQINAPYSPKFQQQSQFSSRSQTLNVSFESIHVPLQISSQKEIEKIGKQPQFIQNFLSSSKRSQAAQFKKQQVESLKNASQLPPTIKIPISSQEILQIPKKCISNFDIQPIEISNRHPSLRLWPSEQEWLAIGPACLSSRSSSRQSTARPVSQAQIANSTERKIKIDEKIAISFLQKTSNNNNNCNLINNVNQQTQCENK